MRKPSSYAKGTLSTPTDARSTLVMQTFGDLNGEVSMFCFITGILVGDDIAMILEEFEVAWRS